MPPKVPPTLLPCPTLPTTPRHMERFHIPSASRSVFRSKIRPTLKGLRESRWTLAKNGNAETLKHNTK